MQRYSSGPACLHTATSARSGSTTWRRCTSKLVREAPGEHVFNAFLANKKIEWDTYRTQVTDYEIKKYLPIL